jgi:membrane protein implicated in regulation of membrane protease activity
MAGIMLEQWHWWTITLLACTFAFYFANSKPAWVAIASTVVGGILWFNPAFPTMYQLGVFFAIATVGTVLTTMIVGERKGEKEEGQDDAPKRILRIDRLIGHVITLDTPIVNGNGVIEMQGATLRLRGADCEAGEKVRVTGIDGIDRELLLVEPVDGVEEY